MNGKERQVPAGIGIPGAQAQTTASGPFTDSGTCFCWLHTHAVDGVRSPRLHRQGIPGNPRNIPLTVHAQIRLEVGTPLVAPQPITFPSGL